MTVLKEKSLGGEIVQLLFTRRFRFGRDRRLCVLPGWQMDVNVNAVSFGQTSLTNPSSTLVVRRGAHSTGEN